MLFIYWRTSCTWLLLLPRAERAALRVEIQPQNARAEAVHSVSYRSSNLDPIESIRCEPGQRRGIRGVGVAGAREFGRVPACQT